MEAWSGMRNFLGEFIGTFVLVFFGCGAVAVSTLFPGSCDPFQIACVWGIALALAIYVSRGLSCAHLNPAVSIAFVGAGRMSIRRLPFYIMGQVTAAFVAAVMLYVLFGGSIAEFEAAKGLTRGLPESVQTAKIFADYFSRRPDGGTLASLETAFLSETFGTFLLMNFVLALTDGCNVGRPKSTLAPVFIGAALLVLICVLAPLSQAGFNPARDFGPRLFAYWAGWGRVALPGPNGGFFVVYILGPIIGALACALSFRWLLQPVLERGERGESSPCGRSAPRPQ